MNVTTGIKPVTLAGFKGMYARGANDTAPQDHLLTCDNCIFPGKDQVDLREPLQIFKSLDPSRNIISFFQANLSTGPALLTLDISGNLRDETNRSTSILHTFSGSPDDFAAINAFGRCYISPKLQGRALNPGNTYYYDNSAATLYLAAGVAPGFGLTATQATTGATTPGTHEIAVSYLYSNGYLSPPSPLVVFNSNGLGINLSGIPTSTAGNVVGRVILMTVANETTLFFVPGGTINDNTTTTFTINTTDAGLVASADYLNRVLAAIPSCSAFKFYSGRMVYIGPSPYPDQLLVSNVNSPDTVDNVQGVVNMPVDYVFNNCNGGMVINRVLYITKPAGTWGVQDNGLVPNEWPVDSVDTGLGAYDTGISNFATSFSGSDVLDTSLVANLRGLMLFNGQYMDRPLSWKIESVWQLISPALVQRIQIAHQIFTKRVYIAVPLNIPASPGARPTTNTTIGGFSGLILMMDYQDGLDPTAVKWSVWWTPIIVNFYKVAMVPQAQTYIGWPPINLALLITAGGFNIYNITDYVAQGSPDNSVGTTFVSIRQSVFFPPVMFGETMATFTMLNFHVHGVGLMSIQITDRTGNLSTLISYQGFNLSSYTSNQYLQRLINYTKEGMTTLVTCDPSMPSGNNGRISLTSLGVYGKVMWVMRPALTESS